MNDTVTCFRRTGVDVRLSWPTCLTPPGHCECQVKSSSTRDNIREYTQDVIMRMAYAMLRTAFRGVLNWHRDGVADKPPVFIKDLLSSLFL